MRSALKLAGLMTALLVLSGCARGEAMPPNVVTTAAVRRISGLGYNLYFTLPGTSRSTSRVAGGMDEAFVADLDRAQQSIDIATFDFDLHTVAEALEWAQRRGVKTRVLIDGVNLDKPLPAWLLGRLQRASIPIVADHRSALMHNKFTIIDRQVLWTGSWNLTYNDTFRNNNNMLRLADPRLALRYSTKFEELWNRPYSKASHPPAAQPWVKAQGMELHAEFSPEAPIVEEIIRRLTYAQRSVDVLAFTFTSVPLADALAAAQARGVHVRVIFEARNAASQYSTFARLQTAGVETYQDGNCFTMHHKVAIIDGERVVTGSFNWTAAAQQHNDENVLMIEDREVAAYYAAEFERLLAQAQRPDEC